MAAVEAVYWDIFFAPVFLPNDGKEIFENCFGVVGLRLHQPEQEEEQVVRRQIFFVRVVDVVDADVVDVVDVVRRQPRSR